MTPLPNGPRGIVRVNLQQVLDPIGTAARWRRKYGDSITLPSPAGKPVLVTGNSAGIRALFSAPAETFDQAFADRVGALLGESSLVALSGAKHSAMRKLLMPPFHGQRMRVYGKQICDLTLQQTRDWQPGRRLIAQDLTHAISLQAIVQLVFGVTVPERVAQVVQLIGTLRRQFSVGLMLPLLVPWLRREFWGFGPWAGLQRAIRALRGFLDQEIAGRRADPTERTDILSLLMAARHEDGTGLGDQAIFEQMQTLLSAGHTTTATALTWALYFLAQEPEARGRLQAELWALGPDPEPEALAKAPFLEAVCHETLRIRPATGAAGRLLRSPLDVAGYELPAGATVMASILWAHSNPDVFPQPERFRPERFLERTYSPFEFLPFGGGNRRCIGAAFALYEMKLVLGTLLQRFSFELASKKPVRVVQRDILLPSAPIPMIVRPTAG